ncbi:MAG TPA: methyltransferase [Pseudonocardiaceae bacterium]|nr:methyltransferase [Pseudonocardiaceae bacterium]
MTTGIRLAGAAGQITDAGLGERCTVVAGDFRTESVPQGADLSMLKNVLHDWPDEQCVRILINRAAAGAPDGRISVLTPVVPDWADAPDDPETYRPAAIADMSMMSVTGRGRTMDEFERLFTAAGLRQDRAIPLEMPSSGYRILEGVRDPALTEGTTR